MYVTGSLEKATYWYIPESLVGHCYLCYAGMSNIGRDMPVLQWKLTFLFILVWAMWFWWIDCLHGLIRPIALDVLAADVCSCLIYLINDTSSMLLVYQSMISTDQWLLRMLLSVTGVGKERGIAKRTRCTLTQLNSTRTPSVWTIRTW